MSTVLPSGPTVLDVPVMPCFAKSFAACSGVGI
jgi:hypothetical protein